MIEINKSTSFELSEDFFKIGALIYSEQKHKQDNQLETSMLFSELNPFFKDGKAAYKVIPGKSRAIVFVAPSIKHCGEQAAYFGYFESVKDQVSANECLNDCEKWAKEHGAKYLIGPINFNTYHKYRVNLDKKNPIPFMNEPFNPEYYEELLKENGFEVLNKYLSYITYSDNKIRKWYKTYSQKIDIMGFDDYSFQKVTPTLWMQHLKEIHQKSEIVFGDNFSYTPIDFETFQIKYGEFFSRLICPDTSLMAFYKGEIVGITLNFPNYDEIMAKGFGLNELSPDTYFENSTNPTLLLKTVGMVKEHANMGFLMIRMMLEIAPKAFEKYKTYICCLMQEGNYPSILAKEFSDHTKEYALFYKKI